MQHHRPEWVAAFRFIGAGTMLALLLAIPVFAFSVWFYLMERAPVGAMGVTIFAQTPAAAFIGYFLLREDLHPTIWLGAGLIIGGILLTLRAGKRAVSTAAAHDAPGGQ
jgi:drug/metabolite transporter (DMT)-like permease